MGIICSNMKHLGKIPIKFYLHCTQKKKKTTTTSKSTTSENSLYIMNRNVLDQYSCESL